MKVTIRDVSRPDHVIHEWAADRLGMPPVGARVKLPRRGWRPDWPLAQVAGYIWVLANPDSGEDGEVQMLLAFEGEYR